MIRNNRRGLFLISRELLEDAPAIVKRVLSDVIVVRAELRWDLDAIEYVAICDKFDECPEGELTPPYNCIIHEDGAYVEWQRDDGILRL